MLDEVLKFYCNYQFITGEEAKRCVRQWPLFRARVSRQRTEKVCDVYVDMLTENKHDMDCILTLLAIMMTINSSTCQCERGFSCMNKQKTNEKTSISNNSLNNIMSIAVNGPDLVDFDASRAVDSWLALGNGD